MRLGTTEIVLIIVLALVLFGGGKLAGVGKALGKSIKDFKAEVKEDEGSGKKEQPSEQEKA
ncbi:MAG: twin-arginine translocase TatA/TatE family subunit [Clostridia bacterium]|nr:twin-arginine translocase TatA/TatE family subunit [Clostridia bacterium]MBR0386740.1 twin-arginine translocase TatA/TatE family subunit [Clostridia bacterium]MBR2663558.1 twin-arginine translocase TatA/TatE family subunit [Clostridia bacterium]